MGTRRKRPAAAAVPKVKNPKEELKEEEQADVPLIKQLRNDWKFAALVQYLFIFGPALKITDTWRIEDFENELLGNIPEKYIPQVKLGLLRNISSHKGLVEGQFEEYTRRQYLAKKPNSNPFGDDEQPTKFEALPLLTRVHVLHQLSQWTLIHPERLREKLDDVSDKAQQEWRMEPCGFDSESSTYFLLDDNRLYKRTEMEIPVTTKAPKASSKKRPAKRRRLADGEAKEVEDEVDPEVAMLASMKWSCICATIEEYREFIPELKKSRHPDERGLYKYLKDDVMPIIEAAEEEKRKEELDRQRKLALETAVANRKRSSRIDAKLARKREEEERAEEERKRQAELEAARVAADRLERIGRERESRLAARERRIMENNLRLALRQREANKDTADDSDNTILTRVSARRWDLEIKKLQEERARSTDEWVFDCICGVYGVNLDDGSPQVACDKCEVWQHVSCLNLSPGNENKEFICERCIKREKATGLKNDEASNGISPKITIKLRLPPQSAQPLQPQLEVQETPKVNGFGNAELAGNGESFPLSPQSYTESQQEKAPEELLANREPLSRTNLAESFVSPSPLPSTGRENSSRLPLTADVVIPPPPGVTNGVQSRFSSLSGVANGPPQTATRPQVGDGPQTNGLAQAHDDVLIHKQTLPPTGKQEGPSGKPDIAVHTSTSTSAMKTPPQQGQSATEI